jgi:hypothetical protein
MPGKGMLAYVTREVDQSVVVRMEDLTAEVPAAT